MIFFWLRSFNEHGHNRRNEASSKLQDDAYRYRFCGIRRKKIDEKPTKWWILHTFKKEAICFRSTLWFRQSKSARLSRWSPWFCRDFQPNGKRGGDKRDGSAGEALLNNEISCKSFRPLILPLEQAKAVPFQTLEKLSFASWEIFELVDFAMTSIPVRIDDQLLPSAAASCPEFNFCSEVNFGG